MMTQTNNDGLLASRLRTAAITRAYSYPNLLTSESDGFFGKKRLLVHQIVLQALASCFFTQ